jgi:hypothetical protein
MAKKARQRISYGTLNPAVREDPENVLENTKEY